MKRLEKIFFVSVLVLAMSIFFTNTATSEPIILKFSDINAKKSAAGVFCEKFAEFSRRVFENGI